MSQSAITVDQVTVTYRNGHTALRDATFRCLAVQSPRW